MLKYLLRRILFFIPTLIVISLLAFVISSSAPGDPVARLTSDIESGDALGKRSELQLQQQKFWTHRFGLDLPLFYFGITPSSFPDTLYKIYDRTERTAVKSLLMQYGNRNSVEAWHQAVKRFSLALQKVNVNDDEILKYKKNEINAAIIQSRSISSLLLKSGSTDYLAAKLNEEQELVKKYSFLYSAQDELTNAEKNFDQMKSNPQRWKNFIPVIHFYGSNQYHRWLFGDGNWLTGKDATYSRGLLRGDFGISYASQLQVSTVIWQRIGWSLLLTFISVVLAYLISLPIGIRAAAHHGSLFDRSSSVILFLLHSMPAFWVATLLLITFANPDSLAWFPASGVKPFTGYPEGVSFLEKAKMSLPYLILPTIAYTYSSLAFLSRLTRVSMLEIIQQDFVKTARAKGLSEQRVIYHHAFRNALLPIITVFANILPAAIGGAVILETIFSIPGMGLETYQAIHQNDYPIILGVFTLTGILTMAGYLLADVLYALVDPRISFSKK